MNPQITQINADLESRMPQTKKKELKLLIFNLCESAKSVDNKYIDL